MKEFTVRGWDGKKLLYSGDLSQCSVIMPHIGLSDRNGTKIFLADVVRVLAGRDNKGYTVVYECAAFCLAGPPLENGPISFIKLRDEFICGTITGKEERNMEKYLEVIGNTFEGVHYLAPSGGVRL